MPGRVLEFLTTRRTRLVLTWIIFWLHLDIVAYKDGSIFASRSVPTGMTGTLPSTSAASG